MYHIPVLLNDAIQGLHIRSGGMYVDVTYGSGGHSRQILDLLGNGKLLAFDQDKDALRNKIEDPRLTLVHANFRFLKNFARLYNFYPIDGILADLGVSSHQIDTPDRGFSTRFDAPLDMRMNRDSVLTAADIINEYPESKLAEIFSKYGEIANAVALASRICHRRSAGSIATTGQLMDIISEFAPAPRRSKYAAQVFQALRIEVNSEMSVLREFLQQALELLRPGGRLVVITYHSLEDRLIKSFMRYGNFDGIPTTDFFGNRLSPFRVITRKPLIPTEREKAANPRARSAKLRIAERANETE